MCTAAMSSFHCPRSPHLVHTPSHPLLSRLSHCATSLLAALRFAYCHACPLASLSHRISLKGTMAILPTSHSRYTLRGRTSSTKRSQRAGKETRKAFSSLYVVRS